MMIGKKCLLAVVGLMILLLTISLVSAVADTKKIVAIETAIKNQWDKPNHPIRVPVIVVHGDHAIADWIQEPRGGRALLMYNNSEWQTIFCGDVLLTKKVHLVNAGVPDSDAEYLANALAQAETNLTVSDMELINRFKGLVDLLKEPHHHAH
jgi:hypothetical protein